MKHVWILALGTAWLSVAAQALEAPPAALKEKAIIDIKMIQDAIKLEQEYTARARQDAPAGASTLNVLEGSPEIIVTVPYASEPFRNGAYRFSDGGGTGALAEMLNKLACATVITSNYRSPSDPNYTDDNPFKDKLRELIQKKRPRVVLDIYASHAFRPYDVDFGTMHGASLLKNRTLLPGLERALWGEGLVNFSFDYFPAMKNQTITQFASNLGAPTIQLQVSSVWLQPSKDDASAHRFAQLLQGLTRYVRNVTNNPDGACPAVKQGNG